jgi:hypothetical protein
MTLWNLGGGFDRLQHLCMFPLLWLNKSKLVVTVERNVDAYAQWSAVSVQELALNTELLSASL